ncbi:MAG TPA: hypothetical protein VGW38_21270, partial [Chloroflexota bacterium]|nr:hypothetical protein [Chloroflexota bacterium]
LYLLGDFGVMHDAAGMPVLAGRPAQVSWSALSRSDGGYPYYAGTLHLTRVEALPADVADANVIIRLPDEQLMFAGVAQLTVNGHALGRRLWAPYAWAAPAGVLRAGTNEVTLSVTNTRVGHLEGKRYDPLLGQALPIVERSAGDSEVIR